MSAHLTGVLGPHPVTQGTRAPAHAGFWKDAPGFSSGSTLEKFRQLFLLPIGVVPQPIVDKPPSGYWDVKIKKLPVHLIKPCPLAGCPLRHHGTTSPGHDGLHRTLPQGSDWCGCLSHSYPYLHTDPCQGTGFWRQLLLRVGRVKLGKGEGGQEPILGSGKEDWVWAEALSPCTSSNVSLTSFTKQKSKGNIINFKMVSAGLSILYKFTFYELSHLILITWGRYNF